MIGVKDLKSLIAVLALAGVGLLVAISLGQPVRARPARDGLQPPFKFVETSPASTPNAAAAASGSTVIFTETFGASFVATTTIGTTPAWRIVANPDDTAGYYWGRVSAGSFKNTAWSATTPIASAPPLNPGVSTYPAGQDTWLIYGPIDLRQFYAAQLSFDYFLDSEPGDWLSWAASDDGHNFFGSSLSGHISSGSQWFSGTLVLDSSTFRTNPVYIAFTFKSGTTPSGLGAFVRQVSLIGIPLQFVYLPQVLNNFAPPPPPPVYSYTFDDAGVNLSQWGGKFDGSREGGFGRYGYGQDVRIDHGNPGNSLLLYTTASFVINASSPNNHAPANFDMYVDMSPWRIYPDNRYGIVFGAGDGTFGADPSAFNGGGNFYLLYVATSGTSVAPLGIRLDRCSGGSCTRLSGNAGNDGYIALPPSFVGNASAFDTVHLQRSGSTVSVWVNNTFIFSLDDSTYIGSRKWGVFILPFQNDPTYPPIGTQMEIDFDNIRVYDRP